jgi:hypothetical protein
VHEVTATAHRLQTTADGGEIVAAAGAIRRAAATVGRDGCSRRRLVLAADQFLIDRGAATPSPATVVRQ